MKKLVVALCSSADFYRQVVDRQVLLEKHGYICLVPLTATKMKESGDFDVSHYKTWFADPDDYDKKSALMRGHFAEIEKGDAVLIINEEKHGITNYIGGNVLIEMALAFYLHKPILIMNDIPVGLAYEEEIRGMQPVVLHGAENELLKALMKLVVPDHQ